MALTQKLQIRQNQALVMTPQLMQAIKLLQLSNLDLAAHVEAELERNPLLERGVDGETVAAGGTADLTTNDAAENSPAPGTEFADNSNSDRAREDPLRDGLLDAESTASALLTAWTS